MPSVIRVLPDHTINQIAAGEVIENPASVVKELVENSLDAKSTRITIEISGGGHQLIRVSDDGVGMSRDDAVLCLERHATSKITSFEDLFSLQSMGFRGEAMSSIAGVSKLVLLTAQENQIGTSVEVEGGKLFRVLPVARQRGTTIEVRSLFYNVPARKKFQKSLSATAAEIHRMTVSLSLAHPLVEFELKGKEGVLFTTGRAQAKDFKNALKNRIQAVLGDEFRQISHDLQLDEGEYQFQGIIGSPEHTRPHRTGQYLFINQRPVFAPFISYAIKEAYGTRIPTNRHPIYVLHMTLSPHLIDVNVHPQKKEVRFKEEISLKQLVDKAVRSSLGESQAFSSPFFEKPSAEYFQEKKQECYPLLFAREDQVEVPFEKPSIEPFGEHYPLRFAKKDQVEPVLPFEKPLQIVGLFDHYLFVKADGLREKTIFLGKQIYDLDLVIVDLIAAQEALSLSYLIENKKLAQNLLFPVKLSFSLLDAKLVESNFSIFSEFGFAIRSMGKNTFAVDAVPEIFDFDDVAKVVLEIVDQIRALQVHESIDENQKQIFAKKICRFAAAKKPPFMLQEGVAILEKLLQGRDPFVTPQGKPTMTCVETCDVKELFNIRKNKLL